MYLSIGVNIPSWVSWAPLHAPDGFFSLPLAIAGYVVVALVIAFAARQTNRELSERMVPMMGVMGAFIFAAQMINFPVAGGTSGHLVGGALAAIILGPWAAILVMTAVVGLQALLFQDGGLVVLGINLFNMSIVSVLAGYGVYSAVGLVKASSKTTLAVPATDRAGPAPERSLQRLRIDTKRSPLDLRRLPAVSRGAGSGACRAPRRR